MMDFFTLLFLLIIVILIALVSAVVALLWGRRQVQDYFTNVYAVRDPAGIEALHSVNIGGIEQWIHVRGRKKDNPILLFLHGGPCWPHIGWHDGNQRPWENYFTVVQWDQRQAGKTYQSMKKMAPTISRQQFLDDTEEMIAHIRKRFGQQKIFLMGTSYGTFLGMHMVKKHPDWFHAYIGVGQVTTMMTHARGEFDELVAYASKHNLSELRSELEALEPYPDPENTTASFFAHGNVLMDHSSRLGKAYPDSVAALFTMSAMGKWISPLYTLRDNMNRKFGAFFDATYPFADEMMAFDLPNEVGHEFDTPIFFFTGINDFHISHKVTDPWFEKINAPYKEQVFFKDSAHVPYQTEPGAFVMALVNKVLPMAKPSELSHESR